MNVCMWRLLVLKIFNKSAFHSKLIFLPDSILFTLYLFIFSSSPRYIFYIIYTAIRAHIISSKLQTLLAVFISITICMMKFTVKSENTSNHSQLLLRLNLKFIVAHLWYKFKLIKMVHHLPNLISINNL